MRVRKNRAHIFSHAGGRTGDRDLVEVVISAVVLASGMAPRVPQRDSPARADSLGVPVTGAMHRAGAGKRVMGQGGWVQKKCSAVHLRGAVCTLESRVR